MFLKGECLMQKISLKNNSTGRSVFVFNNETVLLDCGDTAMVAEATPNNIEIAIGPNDSNNEELCSAFEKERTEAEHLLGIMESISKYKFEYKTLIKYITVGLNAGYWFDMISEAMDNNNKFGYPLQGLVNADDTYGSVGIYIGNYASKNIEDKYFDLLRRTKKMSKENDRSNYYNLRNEFVSIMSEAREELAKHGI